MTDAARGNFTVYIHEEQTAKLVPARRLYYDVQVVTATGVTTLTRNALIRVAADVTRAVT